MAKKQKVDSLVKAWLDVELNENGKSLTQALDELNNKLNTVHTHSRINEWKTNRNGRGERLPRELRKYMAKKAIKSILKNAGVEIDHLNARHFNKIVEQLT